jgi:hypothetical protein
MSGEGLITDDLLEAEIRHAFGLVGGENVVDALV